MKSRTSFSKLTTFKKDLTRFAPVWALYLIGMLLVLFEQGGYYSYDRFARNYLTEFIGASSIINLVYAGLCGVLLFGDLYNTRMCYSLHTMPQRRETWLLSHLASGFSFSLVPNILIAVVMMQFLQDYWFLALYWLLAVELQFIFYYGFATLSAFLTGNRFAMLAVYAGLNFVSLLAYATVVTIYEPMLTGVSVSYETFEQLCPVVYQVSHSDFFLFEQLEIKDTMNEWGYYEYYYKYLGLGEGWGYMAVMAVVGIVSMALSFLLYKLRQLECAGDFIAFRKLNPVACVIITVCVGMCFALVGDVLGGGYIVWLVVGVVIGYFGSLMLIERRIKVFRPKTFLGLILLGAVLMVSILLFKFDVFGVVHWVPEVDEVKSVTVANYNSNNYFYDDYYGGNRMSVTLTEDEDIAEIIEAHEDILKWVDEDYQGSGHYVVLTYKLESGRTVRRAYTAPAFGPNYEIVSKYFYTTENILGYAGTTWEDYLDSVDYIWLENGEVPPVLYEILLEAVREDCENGFVNSYGGDVATYLDIQLVDEKTGSYDYRELYILEGAEKTLALLNSPEMILGYDDWEDYLENVGYMTANGYVLSRDSYEDLLTAMKLDCENGDLDLVYGSDDVYWVEIQVAYPDGTYIYREIGIPRTAENTVAWITAYSETAE